MYHAGTQVGAFLTGQGMRKVTLVVPDDDSATTPRLRCVGLPNVSVNLTRVGGAPATDIVATVQGHDNAADTWFTLDTFTMLAAANTARFLVQRAGVPSFRVVLADGTGALGPTTVAVILQATG